MLQIVWQIQECSYLSPVWTAHFRIECVLSIPITLTSAVLRFCFLIMFLPRDSRIPFMVLPYSDLLCLTENKEMSSSKWLKWPWSFQEIELLWCLDRDPFDTHGTQSDWCLFVGPAWLHYCKWKRIVILASEEHAREGLIPFRNGIWGTLLWNISLRCACYICFCCGTFV